MPLSNEDNADKDFLADFTKKKTHLFGIMMRTSPAKGIPEIDPELFKKHRITLSDLKINNASSSLCTDSYYFALDNEHLVVTLKTGITIKRFETYLNWLLGSYRGDQYFSFSPAIDLDRKTLSNISKIVYADPETQSKGASQKQMTGLRVYNLTMRVLKEICGTAENLQDLIDKDIVKAELLVKFKKPKSMDDEEYAKALSATLKPVSDLENVKISTNDGATIEAGSALKVRRVDIEKQSDGNQINQPQLEQELERFLLDLRSHNENH